MNQRKSKVEKQLINLSYLQPEVDIISLKNSGRKVSVIDINTNYETELEKVIKIVKDFKYNN